MPLSTIGNWKRELKEWTNLNFVTYHGNSEDRAQFRDVEFASREGKSKEMVPMFDCILTTPQMLASDHTLFSKFEYDCVVIDEAHCLKNTESRLFAAFHSLRSQHRVLLTGTPVQNNAAELFALMHAIADKKFPSLEHFTNMFGELKEAAQVARLHDVLRLHLLRRCKDDVENCDGKYNSGPCIVLK